MAKKVDEYEIEVTGDSSSLVRALKTGDKGLEKTEKTARSTASALKLIGGALSVAALVKTTRAVIDTTAEFQRLNAMLKVATGSARGANIAFEGIQQFALETPFTVQQVTEAFIRLKNLGLDPSMEALRSYGNTASAMGRDVMQFVEAIADATVGEFERLKEFGIKASTQGDKVKFTFRGVTTEIGKNAEEIEGYLRGLGQNEFAGAMEEQMQTLNGAISNAGVALDGLVSAFGEKLSPTIMEIANAFAVAADQLRALLNPTIKDEIKDLENQLDGLSAQLTDQEILGRGEDDLARALEAQRRIVQQHINELRGKASAQQDELKKITSIDTEGKKKTRLDDKILEFRKQQEEELFILRAQRLEEEEQLEIDSNEFMDSLRREWQDSRVDREQAEADRINDIWSSYREANIQGFSNLYAELNRQRQADLTKEQQANQQKLNSTASIAASTIQISQNVTQMQGRESRKLFEAQKALNIGLTVANTAAMAIAAGRDTPGPWYVRLAAVLAAVAQGQAQLTAIKNAQFGGGSISASSSSVTTTSQQAPTPVVQPQAVQAQAQGPLVRTIGNTLIAKIVEEEIIPAINEAGSRGVVLEFA